LARKKTSLAFDQDIAKVVRKRGIDKDLNLSESLEAAGLMWGGPRADEHDDLDWILQHSPAEDQKKVRALLKSLRNK
jgi:hypothetical protein